MSGGDVKSRRETFTPVVTRHTSRRGGRETPWGVLRHPVSHSPGVPVGPTGTTEYTSAEEEVSDTRPEDVQSGTPGRHTGDGRGVGEASRSAGSDGDTGVDDGTSGPGRQESDVGTHGEALRSWELGF